MTDQPREGSIVRGIMRYLKQLPGVYAWKTHGNSFVSGLPDIIACVDGEFWAFEVKTPKGRVTKLQKAVMQEMEASGAKVQVVRSKKEVQELLGNRVQAPEKENEGE